MSVFQLRNEHVFPPVHLADEDGLLAYGGDLSAERLILAYESGVFPWYTDHQPVLWWSPPKRMILFPGQFKVHKSFKKVLREERFEMRIDTDFEGVIRGCQQMERPDQEGTWITEDVLNAYLHLHHKGFAHSIESWKGDQLVGGLYGVSLGRVFFGESMFSTESEASKTAFHHLHEFVVRNDFAFIDCQMHTPHLESLGAQEISRGQYMIELAKALDYPDKTGRWTNE